MAAADDIGAMLPQPPPPRPEQRAAAMGDALARYDDTQRCTRPKPEGYDGASAWWLRLFAPQYAALAVIAIVVVISVPQLATTDRATIVSTPIVASYSPAREAKEGTVVATEAPPVPPAAFAAAPPLEQTTPAVVAPPRNADAMADTAAPPAPVVAPQAQDRAEIAAPAPPPPPPAPAMPAEPAPEPSRRAAGAAAEEDGAGSIVVTGQRRRASAAPAADAWSACTLEDPQQDLARCRREIDAGAKSEQGRAAALLADGLSLGWSGDWNGAVRNFDAAIELTPRSALAHLNRALARQRSGDVAGAAADFDQAVRQGRADVRTYYFRGRFRREQGDLRGALQDERRAGEIGDRYGLPPY